MAIVRVKSEEQPYLVERNIDYFEYQLPISVKAVILWKGKVPLLKNVRAEWELPGGKLELGERPETCAIREVDEELGWMVKTSCMLNAWVYEITPERHTLVMTYLAEYDGDQEPSVSDEHKEVALFAPQEIPDLNMPQGYKDSIRLAVAIAGIFEGNIGEVVSHVDLIN